MATIIQTVVNLATDPRSVVTAYGANSAAYSSVKVTGLAGHPTGITTASKGQKVSGAGPEIGSWFGMDGQVSSPTQRSVGAWFWASAAGYKAYFGGTGGSGASVALPPATWTWVTYTGYTGYVLGFVALAAGGNANLTDYCYITGVTCFAGTVAPTYDIHGAKAPAVAPGYSPVGTLTYSWTGATDASTSIETLTAPLQDYQVQLPNATIVGAGKPVGLKSIDGLRALSDVRAADANRGQQDGDLAGRSLLSGRSVVFEFEVFDPSTGTEAALASVARNWQNIVDPSTVVMGAGQYLSQLAGGGSLPVSAVQVQLPGRPVPLLLLGRPRRHRTPVDGEYQFRKARVTAEWSVPDGVLYDTTVTTAACGLPSPVSGMTFPATPPFTFGTSSGGSFVLTNGGTYTAAPVFLVTGPCTRPVITKAATGQFVRLNLTLLAGDKAIVDMQNATVTYNGVNRNNIVEAGSSFFTLPPGDSTIGFASGDSTTVTGTLTGYVLNTYSTI